MNEVIQKLYNKSWSKVDSTNPQVTFMNAFAEAIVQECIKTIQLKIPRSGNTPENFRSYQHVRDIIEHFGIE